MNRFHNKYHRHNHHTTATAGEPDSSHDPIASPSDPFQGDFYVNGTLSAKQGIFDNMSFNGTTAALDQLLITPKVGTANYYFKINSNFSTQALAEIYLNSNPIFVVKGANVGIGTSTPAKMLDVRGDTAFFNVDAQSAYITGALSADGKSQLGYLEFNYVTNANATMTANKGSSAVYIKAGKNDNLKLFANNNNNFTGKLGLKTDSPIETLTINGSQSFRKNGIVLLDNSYLNTLRIITNRQVDSDQHIFTFTGDGRYIAGDMYFDDVYADTASTKIATHKFNIFSATSTGKMLSITNFTPNDADQGPVVEFSRANGDSTNLRSISINQNLGSIRVYGYNSVSKVCTNINASINFKSSNAYTETAQGAYITLDTVCAVDTTKTLHPRVNIIDNGRVGIGISAPTSRLHIKDGDLTTGTGTGVSQDVLTIESGNELNGILVKSNSFSSRIYNKNSNSNLIIDVGATTEAIKVSSAGVVTIKSSLTVATTNYASDLRLKQNITSISNSLDKIKQIRGVNFLWNELKQNNHKGGDVGVIAQEIEKILPEAVSIDEEGIKLVQYHKIIPLLIECIKDLKSEIDALKVK